jgi:hypothetical protein
MKNSFKLLVSFGIVVATTIFINTFYLIIHDTIPYTENTIRNGAYKPATLNEVDTLVIKDSSLGNNWSFIGDSSGSIVDNSVVLNADQEGLLTNKLSTLMCRYLVIKTSNLGNEPINATLNCLDKNNDIRESIVFSSDKKESVFAYQTEFYHKEIVQFSLIMNQKSATNAFKINSFVVYNVN